MLDSTSGEVANRKTFDDYYDKPDWWFRWRYGTQIKRKSVLALLSNFDTDWSGKNIFELGFGSGDLLFSFPKSSRLIGVEISSTAILRASRLAKERGYSTFEFKKSEASGLISLASGSIDLAIASHVLEHVENLDKCLSEIFRILKPGGLLVVLIPLNERYPDANHVRILTSESCKVACMSQGFTFRQGFENDLLFYVVERMYWKNAGRRWSLIDNAARVLFNVLAAPLPFWLCRTLDRIVGLLTNLPARQAAMVFTIVGKR
jgi:ubiquinone/menaquinone biosynthesis C-methylase UbiE